jgi:hypothetical protein
VNGPFNGANHSVMATSLGALHKPTTHAINVAVAEAYLAESNALASEVERGRRDLLDRLLSGRAVGDEERRRAEALGLRPNGDHAVVVAVLASGGAEAGERLIVRALVRQEPQIPFVVARHREVVAIAPVYVRRGPRELRAALERRAEALRRNHRAPRSGSPSTRTRSTTAWGGCATSAVAIRAGSPSSSS